MRHALDVEPLHLRLTYIYLMLILPASFPYQLYIDQLPKESPQRLYITTHSIKFSGKPCNNHSASTTTKMTTDLMSTNMQNKIQVNNTNKTILGKQVALFSATRQYVLMMQVVYQQEAPFL